MNSILLISLILPKYAVAIVKGTSTGTSTGNYGKGNPGISGGNNAWISNGFKHDDTFHADFVDCPTDINYNITDDLSDDKHHLFKYQGGWLVPNVSFYPIFWSLPNKPVNKKEQLKMFYQDLVGSSFMTALADDFSVPGQTIGTGSYLGSFTYNTQNTTTLTDDAIQAKLAKWVANGILPYPNRNTYFSIHFGPGITVSLNSKDTINNKCENWCAYHNAIDARCAATKTIIQYGVVIDTSSEKCQQQCVGIDPKPFNFCPQWSDRNFDIQTILSSHEIAEMVTNPFNNGWINPKDKFENADYCKSISFFLSSEPRFNTTGFSGCLNTYAGQQVHNLEKRIVGKVSMVGFGPVLAISGDNAAFTQTTPASQQNPTTQTTIIFPELRPRYAVQQFFSPKQGKCVASTANISPAEEDVKNTYCNRTTIEMGAANYSNIQISYIPIHDAQFFTCPNYFPSSMGI